MTKELANTLIVMFIVIGAALGGAIGIRAGLGEPLLPWQNDTGHGCCVFTDKATGASLSPDKQGRDYPPGDSFGLFAPHEEDDPGFNCLMHGNRSC